MLSTSGCCLVAMARYQFRNPWYYPKRGPRAKRYGLSPNKLRNFKLDNVFRGLYFDNKHDMSDRENIDETEEMRNPTEKDFYQDHTYHSQWEQRDLDKKQKADLCRRYAWMAPGYKIQPWVWYPGDLVEVVVGDDRGKRGRIRNVLAYKNEIVVEGINVQQEEIPARDDRPKQVLHLPSPIHVKSVKHVDEKTNGLCELRILTVKREGQTAKVRASTTSGWVLPIPEGQKPEQNSDPMLDTTYMDAIEETFDEKEIDDLAQMKLEALEKHFVSELKQEYEYNRAFQKELEKDKERYQHDVWVRAKEMLFKKIRETLAAKKESA